MGEKFDYNKYQTQYKKDHYERLVVELPKDAHYKNRMKTLADREGISISQWILRLIKERLERDE